MKILVDENIPRMTVDRLQELGYDVKDIRGTAEQGLADPDMWSLAITEGRLLITTDKGFIEHRRAAHHGILIIRLRQPNRLKIHQSVMTAIGQFQEAEWPGLIVAMRDTTIRKLRAGSSVKK